MSYILTPAHRKNLSKAMTGKKASKSNAWKGGEYRHSLGYIYAVSPNHPHKTKMGYVMKHKLVMEAHLGHILPKCSVVHHIDGDKANNSIENLMLFPNHSAHLKYHHSLNRKKRD